jgi:hypothetical protein
MAMIEDPAMSMTRPFRFRAATMALCCLAAILLAPRPSGALTVTTTPRSANISPGAQGTVHLIYTALENLAPNASYTATSTQGRFETPDGTPLGTVERTVTISVVNSRGSATELLNVPARITAAAMQAGAGRIVFRRSFRPSLLDLPRGNIATTLQIVPQSAGEFALVGLRLEFNQPAPGDAPRPTSGGRITVPRHTKGLRAAAIVTYNGQGLLRGRWVVDGQILGFVNKPLMAGMREAIIASPAFPAFPTYATGLHSVRFEITDPVPAFDTPSLLYFVTAQDAQPAAARLELVSPPAREHVALDRTARPVFSWQGLPEHAIYLFRIVSLEPDAVTIPTTGEDTSRPVLSARTAQTSYTLSPFDLGRLATNTPYAWQVQAHRGSAVVAASEYRIVLFSGPPTDLELTVPLRDQGTSGQ